MNKRFFGMTVQVLAITIGIFIVFTGLSSRLSIYALIR